ncbi:MAG: 2-aminoethylphosphonate aminotransferase [Gammaproteobacteria bacterium]|nr:2-aminoethylphosphonate aminotransferase [Gammaproteobacteria bacterium]
MILLNPGPVTLSPRVRAALGRGDWCHREPEFAALVRSINERLAAVYPDMAGRYEAVLLTGSGTAAVEAMLATFAPREQRTLVLANGVYGERIAAMLAAHGRPHELLAGDWTAAVDLAALEQRLAADPMLRHVAVVQHETTTGRLTDLAAIGALCRRFGARLLLDAVSSFGAEHIDATAWNLQALAGTANKCLHGVPGLAFVLAERAAWAAPKPGAGSLYLDLRPYHRAQHGDGYSPFTQAVQVAFALDEALREHAEAGGWQARQRLYRERAARVHCVLAELGLAALLPEAECSCVLRSYRVPAWTDYARLHAALKARGFVIYAGQGRLAPAIFRIAVMGDLTPDDLTRLGQALTAARAGGAAAPGP